MKKVVDWFGDLFGEGDYLDYEEDYTEVKLARIKLDFEDEKNYFQEATTKKYYPDLGNESLSRERSIRKGLEILNRGGRRWKINCALKKSN